MKSLRIGTRGSPLALWQARHVAELLVNSSPAISVELVEIQTAGDDVRDVPLFVLGGIGVFTKAIQDALLENRVDIAVHSLKDLPTVEVEGLVLGAVPKRGAVGDVLISKKYRTFPELPAGAVVATSSLRRKAQLLYRRRDLNIVDIRGNVETRLRKLVEHDLDAILLAQAGLERLGLSDEITEVLDTTWMCPAVGQGALAIECRADDQATRDLLDPINDLPTRWSVLGERALLRGLGGGCQVPIGARSEVAHSVLTLHGVVLSPDGDRRIEADIVGPIEQAEWLGDQLAKHLIDRGADKMLIPL